MKTISIDIETYSSVNLAKAGVYKYVESGDFEILLFAYSVDQGPVRVVDLASGERIPDEIIAALTDDSVTKWAFNAQFERVCLSRYLGYQTGAYLDPVSWKCSMVWSAVMGLPLSLEGVGTVLGLEKQKLTEGKDLIRYFCVPCKPTKVNGGRKRNLPCHDAEKWTSFKSYNVRDVEVEMQIQDRLSKFPVSDEIWTEYHMDQAINDRGILVDKTFVEQALITDKVAREELTDEIGGLTGLENPNSVLQMREWLQKQGIVTESLDKKSVAELIPKVPEVAARVLSLRQKLAKSSVKKYQAMETAVCSDGRIRGCFMFYGANRTGRFAGRLVQLQNLPQNHMSDLAEARSLIRSGNLDALTLLYDDIPDTLSQLIRTAFIPSEGNRFFVADFSAIEARVIAWLAGEDWRMKAFKDGADIYCASASKMFGVPVEKHGVNGHLRQKGKIAELALGYGGSVGALTAMGALEMGLDESELKPLVDSWRGANPNIVNLWWSVGDAVITAIKKKCRTTAYGITFEAKSGMLFITLPSGRRLSYVKPRIGENRFGGESVTYEGVGATKKWERLESYGPKFVENIIQATARDLLMHAIKNLSGYRIVAHVHDEVIIEAPAETSLDEICETMAMVPEWGKGLILNADGYECDFYQKD